MTICTKCGNFVDTDECPEGYYRGEDSEPSDDFQCQSCNEEA